MYRSGSLTTAARELARYKLNLVGYRKLGGTKGAQGILIFFMEKETTLIFFFGGATAWGGPWPPLQYASRPLDPLLVSPFVYPHLSQVRGHVIQPSHFWSSSLSCCIKLSVQHLFWNCGVLHSFYVTKPSYSLAFNEPDNVLPFNYSF